jgi:hypothetical protein
MKALRKKYYRGLFLIAAIYDLILGILFTFFYRNAFELIGISETLPEFGAYLSLIGAFLFVIGVAYYLIYRGDFQKNRDLILIGALYKLAYCSIAFFYSIIGDIPHMIFLSLFGVVGFIIFISMVGCFIFIRKISSV